MEIALYIIVAIVAGVAIGVLLGKVKQGVLTTKLTTLEKAADELKKENEELKIKSEKAASELLVERTKNEGLSQKLDWVEQQNKKALSELQGRFDVMSEKMTEQMKNATADMLNQRQKEFAEKSNKDIGQIVNPLRETIDKMKKTMEESTLKQTEMSGEMKANLENMMRHSEAAKKSAEELTRVFKHGSKVQGDWGEKMLSELLSAQGLVEGRHYDSQTTMRDAKGNVIKNEAGAMLRPDVIMHLDTSRELIIDSKVSLKAFIDYVNAETEEERQRFLKEHIDSLKKHVDELSKKDYSTYITDQKVKMDYVIMFVPHSGALWTALNKEHDLWRNAMAKNVFIADEQTLYAALRIIDLTWTQITQAQNHAQVYKLADEMIARVGQFCEKYDEIGKALTKATEAYASGRKKLEPSGQSIINTSQKLIKLGAKKSSKKALPMIENAELLEIDEDKELN